jgi:hypothetical protein
MGKKQSTGKSQPKPKPKAQSKPKPVGTTDFVNKGGSYQAFENGRVGRTYGLYGPYESMDTTGYAKGKKTFDLMEDGSVRKKVTRSEVPATIARLKQGATRTVNYTRKKSK